MYFGAIIEFGSGENLKTYVFVLNRKLEQVKVAKDENSFPKMKGELRPEVLLFAMLQNAFPNVDHVWFKKVLACTM